MSSVLKRLFNGIFNSKNTELDQFLAKNKPQNTAELEHWISVYEKHGFHSARNLSVDEIKSYIWNKSQSYY